MRKYNPLDFCTNFMDIKITNVPKNECVVLFDEIKQLLLNHNLDVKTSPIASGLNNISGVEYKIEGNICNEK